MEHTLDSQTMKSAQALAATNLQISEARVALTALQEEETAYLVTREKKATDRIQKVVDESRHLVTEMQGNYQEVHELLQTASDFAVSLVKIHASFSEALSEFEEKNIAWEKSIGKQQDDIEEVRKVLNVDKTKVKNDQKTIELRNKAIENEWIRLKDERGTLTRAIERLKDNKV